MSSGLEKMEHIIRSKRELTNVSVDGILSVSFERIILLDDNKFIKFL